jgi:cysteine dioxygenase
MVNTDKINELINCISTCDKDSYIEKIKSLNLTKKDFEGKINFSEKKYTRTCLAKNNGFELILLAWTKGQKTPIHNHDGKECFVFALDGDFEEVCYTLDSQSQKMKKENASILKKGELAYTEENEKEFHSIENLSEGNALSIHLYRKPIESCLVYNEQSEEIASKNLSFDFE